MSDGITLALYVNGTLQSTVDSGYPIAVNYAQMGGGFVGTLDEVRLYDRAISAEEVVRLFNIGG